MKDFFTSLLVGIIFVAVVFAILIALNAIFGGILLVLIGA